MLMTSCKSMFKIMFSISKFIQSISIRIINLNNVKFMLKIWISRVPLCLTRVRSSKDTRIIKVININNNINNNKLNIKYKLIKYKYNINIIYYFISNIKPNIKTYIIPYTKSYIKHYTEYYIKTYQHTQVFVNNNTY